MPSDPKQSSLTLALTQLESSHAPASSTSKAPSLHQAPDYCRDVSPTAVPMVQTPRRAHLSFLRSPRAAGLTAILGNVEAEVWDWLQEDRVSMFRGDCGGVLHSECDNEPARKGAKQLGLCDLTSLFPCGPGQDGDAIQECGSTPRPHCRALNSDAGLHVAFLPSLAPRRQA